MCRTPAPPSTARVAASIWSGTGEVNTWPAAAASSMPSPTNPPWSGSWPEPPPEMRRDLALDRAAGAEDEVVGRVDLDVSGAPPRPGRLSGTMSSTALMSFFIRLGAFVAMGSSWDRSGMAGGQAAASAGSGTAGPARSRAATDELVGEGADQPTDDGAGDVHDGQRVPGRGRATDEPLHDVRADLARRVQGGTGDRADEDDDPVDDEPDGDAGEARRGLAADRRAEDREHEDGRADDLGREADRQAGVGVDADGAEAEGDRVVALQDDERQGRAEECADELGGHVGAGGRAVDLAGGQQGDRDRRVDVAAADVADRVDRREDREGERERDRRQAGRAVDPVPPPPSGTRSTAPSRRR